MYIRLFLFVYHSAQVMKKKKLNLLYFIFCNELYIDYFRIFEEETLGSRIRTEERPLVGKTWTPQLLLFLWSLLVRVNFIFIFFFFTFVSLSVFRSFVLLPLFRSTPSFLKIALAPKWQHDSLAILSSDGIK